MTQSLPPLIHPETDPFLAAIAADVVQSLAVDVLADPRWVESPCGPVLAPSQTLPEGEHCPCCAHRRVGDHAGPVCPCADGWGER